jgi:2-polyprenyl-6-methoxyphenol hydroxylase-like FAD-dependent oxidoreductase
MFDAVIDAVVRSGQSYRTIALHGGVMKVVICGAGIAGLALANRMSALDAEIVVLERSAGPRTQGYMIDFFGPGYDAVTAMGLLPAIESVAYQVREASFLDEHGRRRAGIQPSRLAVGPLISITRPDLERVLRESLSPKVDLRFGVSPVAVAERFDRVRVILDNGSDIDADLLVGADGVHSTVRRLTLGDESRFFRYLGFHTAAFRFDAPDVREAMQGRACLTDTIGRQMGFYALRDGRVAAFSVHRTSDRTWPDDIRETLRAVYGGLGWIVPTALERCPPSSEIFYDQVGQIVMPRWSSGRVVLVGDACYAVSLLAGQGASLAVAGAYVLAEQLSAQSIDQALVRYEQLWRPIAEEKQKVGRAGGRWFLPKSDLELRIRRASLRMAGLPLVSRAVAKVIAGRASSIIAKHPVGTS